MFKDMNSGYDGFRMSNRAVEAYENNEKPKSQWRKNEIMAMLQEYAENNNLQFNENLKKLKKDDLIKYSSWHHTGKLCNKTDFYTIKYDVLKYDDTRILDIIMSDKKNKEKEENNQITLAKIGYEVYEGKYKKYRKWISYEEFAVIKNGWAYTKDSKKSINSSHCWIIEEYKKAPRGTAVEFNKIRKRIHI